MVTAQDCAALAEAVYHFDHDTLVGWAGSRGQNGTHGFAAATYEKDGHLVVAFRGTETHNLDDIFADARMVPNASVEHVLRVVPSILHEYGLSDSPELNLMGSLLTQVLTHFRTRLLISSLANQAPPQQSSQALAYVASLGRNPVVVTGHSLGGALAKVVALRRGLLCVAFNSPFMGDLRGVPPLSSTLRSINAVGDPLSLATKSVGNLPHGQEIQVRVPGLPDAPPSRPEVETYRRPTVCPRATGSWYSEEAILTNMAATVCEAALDVWEPVGRVVSVRERSRSFFYYPEYVASLVVYLGRVAGHYHSMANLRAAMEGETRFQQNLLTV